MEMKWKVKQKLDHDAMPQMIQTAKSLVGDICEDKGKWRKGRGGGGGGGGEVKQKQKSWFEAMNEAKAAPECLSEGGLHGGSAQTDPSADHANNYGHDNGDGITTNNNTNENGNERSDVIITSVNVEEEEEKDDDDDDDEEEEEEERGMGEREEELTIVQLSSAIATLLVLGTGLA
ncbi:hypothetical protein EGR_08031 [Echinococcus granulosus]|uniref:Uncharacterized protein n=1 Tax=Echinococcus granulosus TaxID=6210 RepID=W6U779_ECHGR|nr:hypothetical protein EGR_08031 [Echinococcus granulosus]EUB57083.1 hypothetical protein EGR_08031 [Echinococcus granulosus]